MVGMVVYVSLLLASLAAGVAVGTLGGEFPVKRKKYLSIAMLALVFLLILLMGIKTGSNTEVISNLGTYGLQALVITVAAIVGSIIFALLFERLVFRDGVR